MIRLAKVHKVTLEDGRDIWLKDIPIKAIKAAMKMSDVDDIDGEALAEILLCTLCNEDGSPLDELKGMSASDLADNLPAGEAMALMGAVMEVAELGK